MNRLYDLHTHSTFSDGSLSPSALLERARDRSVQVLALTDHDTTAGLPEARAAAARMGVELVAGIEISVTWSGQTIHVVGLRIEPDYAALQTGLERLRLFRNWRAEEIDRRLARKRITGILEGARQRIRGAIISRTHFAHELVARGHARDLKQAFKRFLRKGGAGHVAGEWAALDEAVSWIKGAGGEAVIAHPARYKLSNKKLHRLLNEFKECGGVGIEVNSGSQAAAENERFAGVANAFALLASSGSDYHGPEKPWVELGGLPPIPANCTPIWQGW